MGFEELEEIIKSSVKLFEIKEDNLYIILFAAFRCINNDMDFIENLLEKWDMFGKKDDEIRFPFIEELRLTFRDYPVTDNVLNYLCFNFQEFSNIKHSIWYICSELNKPLSFKMTLDYLSDNEYLFDILPFFRRIQISSESRIFLENYYKKEDIKGHSKKYAFRLWAMNCNENDLPKLQKIDKDNILFSESLITRIRLGDLTALNSFIKNFDENVVLNEIHNVWNDEAKLFVEKCFKDMELNENKEIQDGYDYVDLYRFGENGPEFLMEDVIVSDIAVYEDGTVLASTRHSYDAGNTYIDLVMKTNQGEQVPVAADVNLVSYVGQDTLLYLSRGSLYRLDGQGLKQIARDIRWFNSKQALSPCVFPSI